MKNFFETIKKGWKAYLERLAKTNQKLYGQKPLSCCQINSQPKKAKKYHT